MIGTTRTREYGDDTQQQRDRWDEIGRSVTTKIQALQEQPQFSGMYDDDLENVAEIYALFVKMCDASWDQKRKAMSVMLKWSALSLFIRKLQYCQVFEQGIVTIQSWLDCKDQPSRLLVEQHAMSLL